MNKCLVSEGCCFCYLRENKQLLTLIPTTIRYLFISWNKCSVQLLSCVWLLWPHGLQHTRLHCPSPTTWAYLNSCPPSWWCHPTISPSVVPISSRLNLSLHQSLFQWVSFFTSGGQSIGVTASASVLLMNTQDWSPLGWAGWITLQSKGLSRVFSNSTVQKHQFFSAQLSL